MTLALYHGRASTCSKKVRLCLYEKGLPFESHLLDLQKFEQHDPAYLAINPNGVVPALVDDGRPVIESTIIMEYLEDRFPDPPLRPEDPHERARVRLWTRFSDEVATKAVFAPTWQHMRSRAAEGLTEAAREATLARIPTAERREAWLKSATTGYSAEELDAAYARMRLCIDRIETALADSDWLVGRSLSHADLAMVPFVLRFENVRPDLMPPERFPRLAEWYARLRARPAVDRALDFRDDLRAQELPNI